MSILLTVSSVYLELNDKKELFTDGGVFASSARTFLGPPNYATTMFTESSGTTKRYDNDSPQTLMKLTDTRHYRGPILPHTFEPSKFWELGHTDKDVLIPVPLVCFRDLSLPAQINHIVRGSEEHRSNHAASRRLSRGVDGPSSRTSMQGGIVRSSSAPPRTTLKDVESASKWAIKSLSDVVRASFESARGRVDDLGFQVIPSVVRPAERPTEHVNQFDSRFTEKNAIGIKSRTLRRQLRRGDSSQAPFALDY